jgi:hypothetical protein
MGSGLSFKIRSLGPISGELQLDFDVPLVILTGETGTGKSFLLRMLSILFKNLEQPLDVKALEGEFTREFKHPRYVVFEGADEGEAVLSYEGDVLVGLTIRKKLGGLGKLHADFIEIGKEMGGVPPYAELARRSIIAPSERVPLTRHLLLVDYQQLRRLLAPSTDAYCSLFVEMCGMDQGRSLLEEMLSPLVEEGLIPRVPSYFDRGLVAGYDANNASSAALSLLSLAPVAYRLNEGRAFLAAVDTIELHLTPLLQAVAAVDLARRVKRCREESEEYPVPLLMITHSSIVLSALLTEVEEGVKDRLVMLDEKYKLGNEDVKTVVLYRRDGAVCCDIAQGIALPNYLREYARFL